MTKITFAKNNDVIIDGKKTSYYVREGNYRGACDDKLGRWYIGRHGDPFRPFGRGFANKTDAVRSAGMEAMRKPTDGMLKAARDWSHAKYGKPIGNDDAIGCWQAMLDAALED